MLITRIETCPLFGTIHPDRAIVSALGRHVVGNYLLVKVHDDAGRVGLGEASVTSVWSGETQGGARILIEEVLAPLLIGVDPHDSEWIGRRLDQAAYGNSFAKAALEMALLDLQGQALGLPLHKLLGGSRPGRADVRLKFVIGARDPDDAARLAFSMVEQGWTALKVKIGRHEHPRWDLARLEAVRTAVGPDVWLSVDANGGYTVAQALWIAPHLERLGVTLFEQPTRRGDHLAMAAVRRRSGVPIMADESLFTPQDALDLIRHEAADVFSVYPGKHGGVRPTQAIARLAEAAGIPCTIGSNLEREVATAAMAHVAAATPNIQCETFPGDLIGPLYFTESLTQPGLSYQADRLLVPQEPGLGVKL